VRVRRPGATVTARDRYTRDDTPAAIVESDDAALVRAVGGVLSSAAMPLDDSVVPLLTTGDPGAAAFVVGRLSRQPESAGGTLTLLSAAFTPRGRSVASKRVTLRPVDLNVGTDPRVGLVSGLPLEPGPYEVRVAVEGPAATGSVHTFVEVPDFARDALTLSGVLLHVAPEEVTAPREEVDGLLPFVPTARRAFAPADVVSAFLQVSQGTRRSNPLQMVDVRIRVLNVQGAEVRVESMTVRPDQFASNRAANVRFSIPTSDLAAGRYLLSIDAQAGNHSASRTIRFEIR
jgi:hypothetical protein